MTKNRRFCAALQSVCFTIQVKFGSSCAVVHAEQFTGGLFVTAYS